jgi:mannose-6-phosphate isomerase
MTTLHKIKGHIQHYDWGGNFYIPDLLGLENKSNLPYAEYWLGDHPGGKFEIISPQKNFFSEHFPFLFKVLDVDKMLSIQAHPNKEQAIIGFEEENKKKIPLNSALRVFKDQNHKPELMVAMSDFWLLHGFVSIDKFLKNIEPLKIEVFLEAKSIKEAFQILIQLPNSELQEILSKLRDLIKKSKNANPFDYFYWIEKALEQYPDDKGLLMIPMLNLVFLKKGDAIFQDSGIPHAYLKGVNLEIMASSDNVFRGGLTNKHIDSRLLQDHLVFDEVRPVIIQKKDISSTEYTYPTTSKDFQLNLIEINENQIHAEHTKDGPCVFLILEGKVEIENDHLIKGESFLTLNENHFKIKSLSKSIIVKAFKP